MHVLQGVARKGLSREEERDLIVRLQAGDDEALRELVSRFRLLVAGLVGKYVKRSSPLWDDLFQEGCLGLLDAAGRFDLSHGTRFSTYSRWWVRYYIQTAHRNAKRVVRHRGRGVKRWWDKGRAAEQKLRRDLGREPTTEELAKAVNVAPDVLEEALMYLTNDDMEFDERVHGATFDIDAALDLAKAAGRLDALIDQLGPRERKVIRAYYLQGKSLRDVGKTIGVSGERTRQIRDRALGRLKDGLGYRME